MDWKWFISAQEESENPQPSTFVQTPCEMAGASFGLSSYLRNKTWLVSAQCGRRAMRVSVLKQDKCSGNEFKHIFTMKADNFLSGLAGMVCKAKGSSAAGRAVAFAAAMPRVSSATMRGKAGNVGQAWITNTGTCGFLALL